MNQEPLVFILQKQLIFLSTSGGQFAMAAGGHIALASGGQFKPVTGGQFEWIFQTSLSTNILCEDLRNMLKFQIETTLVKIACRNPKCISY